MDAFLESLNIPIATDLAIMVLRILIPILGIIIVYQIYSSLRRQRREEKALVMLVNDETGDCLPVVSWENSLGRSKSNDIVIDDDMTISREHCALLRREDGWFINDTGSKFGTYLNGEKITQRTQIYINDEITLGETTLTLERAEDFVDISSSWFFKKKGNRPGISPFSLMLLITIFMTFLAVSACVSHEATDLVPLMFLGIYMGLSWTFYFVSTKILGRTYFELESLAIFLTGIGIMLSVRQEISQTYMQVLTAGIGMVMFCIIIRIIKNPDRVERLRVPVMILSLGFLCTSIVLGQITYGAANWISIGGISIQPSEFVKIAFIFVGASALDELQRRKNLIQFVIYSILCVGALFLMSDFGTALIFFGTFLMISFMRSGDFKTVILALVSAVLGGAFILRYRPYIANRFSAWGHVFEHANDLGYQQARVLTYAASGGLFGVGLGNGYLKYVGASESDLVFGLMCEEYGLILALTVAICIVGLFFYARAITTRSRSTFYSITACCAAGLLVLQSSLNIFGATDILPLTGVTLPFVSVGGSSMVACWGLLAFIKAADERTYSKSS